MCDLVEDNWILLTVSAFNFLQYVIFVEIDKENLISYKHVVGKGRSILIAFSYNCEYFSLITVPKLDKWQFLKG